MTYLRGIMCGFCVELLSLEIAKILPDPEGVEIDIVLQETEHLQAAIEQANKKNRTTLPSFIARLAGTIARDPNVSAEFRQILFDAMATSKPTSIMPSQYLQWLSGERIADTALLETASYHLKKFIDWWFHGQIIPKDITMDESIWPSISAVSQGGLEHLYAIAPTILMSLGLLKRLGSHSKDTKDILINLVAGQVPDVPVFDGLDLWIQRVVILDCFDLFGVEALWPRLKEIRPFLWAYLMVKREVSAQVRARLDKAFGENWIDDLLSVNIQN